MTTSARQHHADPRSISVYDLLHGPVLGPSGQYWGYVVDVAVTYRPGQYPLVTGVLACLGSLEVYISANYIIEWRPTEVQLATLPPLIPFAGRANIVLVRSQLFRRRFRLGGHKLQAKDFVLSEHQNSWLLTTLDTRGPLARRCGICHAHSQVDWNNASGLTESPH